MSDLPPVVGVAEIVINVDNLPIMRQFYRDVLRFQLHSELSMETETLDPSGEPTICFLTIAETKTPLGLNGHPQLLALIDYRRHMFAKRFAGRLPSQSTLNHLAFEITPESFDQYLAHFCESGLNPVTTEFPAMNAHAIFVNDPEENRIELIAHQQLNK